MNFKSIKVKLVCLTILSLMPLFIGLFTYIFPTYSDFFINQKKTEIRSSLETFNGSLQPIIKSIQNNQISHTEGIKQMTEIFNETRYNKTGYFFAFDRKGFVKAHGLVPTYVNENWFTKKDSDGKTFVQSFISETLKKESGFVNYKFIRKKGGLAEDKVSYVTYIPELQWIIGTGLYISEVQKQIAKTEKKIIIGFILVAFLAIILSLIFSLKLSKNLSNIASDLNNEAGNVNEISLELKSISDTLSKSSHEQVSALQQTSASVLETSMMIERNSENAKTSIEIADKSLKNVHLGKQSINEVVSIITQISQNNQDVKKQIEENNQDISNLVTVINEIGQKTEVINDIVFQTKLLSFNASVEAARSGEHGKGFAVVAEEISNLAELSGQSAKEISDILNASIEKVESTVASSKSNIDNIISEGEIKVNNGVATAKNSLSLFNEIVDNSNKISQVIDEISSASDEQAIAVKAINVAITELDQAAKENSIQSVKTSNSADDIKNRIEHLKTLSDQLIHTING